MKKTNRSSRIKLLQLFIVVVLACSMMLAVPFTTVSASVAKDTKWMEADLSKDGKFDNPYTSLEEVLVDARAKHEEVVDEGTTLLKNNGILPLNATQTGSNKVTVFNSCDGLNLGLEGVGFTVNSVSLSTAQNGSAGATTGYEGSPANKGIITEVDNPMKASFKKYHDAAIVRIVRTAGEANEVSTGRGLTTNAADTYVPAEDYGDITWVKNGQIVPWNKTDYEAGLLQEAWPDGTPKGWNHEHLSPDEPLARYSTTKDLNARSVKPVRHALMLSLYEEKMIQIAKEYFDNVIVVYDSITQFELYDLEKDPDIDAIIHSGRMTATNVNNPSLWAGRGVARVISGQVTPSGHLVSQWDRDMTADPTWQNFGDNFQNDSATTYEYSDGTSTGTLTRNSVGGGAGLHGIEYEEGIYLGYKFYETYWAESKAGNTDVAPAEADNWHATHVAYPFGYGLSYADFDYEIVGVKAGSQALTDGQDVPGSYLASAKGAEAQIKTIYVTVKVTNTSSFYGGKAVPQIYITAPYKKGEIEKSYVVLGGFDKTRFLNPGQSDTLVIPVEVQDFASFDYKDANNNGNKGYELDEGEYVIRLMDSSSERIARANGTYDEFKVNITNGGKPVNLKLDDFSDNEVEPLFSTPNTRDYSIRDENVMAAGGTPMTILSRNDMDETFPKAPTYKDLRFDDNYIDDFVRANTSYLAGYTRTRASTGLTTDKSKYALPAVNGANAWYYNADKGDYAYIDDPSDPWYVSRDKFDEFATANAGANWTQVAQSVRDNDTTGAGAQIKIKDMAGIALYAADGKINAEWDKFMNQLTYLELQIIVSCGNSRLARIDAIGKNNSAAKDNTSVIDSIYHWGDQPLLARTWNLDLCADHGRLTAQYAIFGKNSPTGWWSPGCDLQRSPFSGRNGDYYSQDALFGGKIIAAVCEAAEDCGLACWIKHFILNDQETNRNGLGLFTWGDEQTFRENYFPIGQKAFQEGHAKGNMQSFARIGGEVFASSYAANTLLVREQWGWTGTSVTDAFAGMVSYDYIVPENPINWFEAASTIGADGKATAYDKTKKFDQTKNWNYSDSGNKRGRTATCDQLVRGANGLPDSTPSSSSIFQNGEYVNTLSDWNDDTSKFNSTLAKGKTLHTTTRTDQINVASGIWSDKMENGKGGVYLEYEAGKNTADVMDKASATMTATGWNQWYAVRMTAMYACYECANSYGNKNGMLTNDNSNKLRSYHGTTAKFEGLTQGTAIAANASVALADDLNGNTVKYTVIDGTLPAGLALDATTGAITGTPTDATATDTVVTVECRVANYLEGTKTVTFAPIASTIAIDKTAGVAGEAFTATLSGFDGTYAVAGLPAGLALDGATISGTPTIPGAYDIVITATVGKVVYTSNATITVGVIAESDVSALISSAVDAAVSGKITSAQAQEIANAAVSGKLSEAEVKALIDEAIAAHKAEGCGSAVSFATVGTIIAMLALAFVAIKFVAKKD